MTRTRFLSVVLAVLAISCAGDRDRLFAAEGNSKPAPSDSERIRGHWVASKQWGNGELVRHPNGTQIVFTDKEMKFQGLAWQYELDPNQTPKRLKMKSDVIVLGDGIYRFDGEKLWLSSPTSSRAGTLKDFESKSGDRRQVFLLERGNPNADARPILAPGFKLADKTVAQELHKTASQAAELLEKKQYAQFFKELAPPDELAKMVGRDKKTLEEVVECLPKARLAAAAGLFRAMDKKIPAVNEAGTWAYFDLQNVHVNGAPGKPVMFFRKVNGTWHMTDKEPELPKKGKR